MKLKSIFISILFTITSCSVIVPNNIKYINDDIPEFHKFKNKYQTTKNKSEPYFGDISIKLKTNLIERIAPNISTNKEIAFGIKSKDSIIERKRKFLLGNTINNKFSSIFDPNNSNLFSSTLKPYEGEVKIGNGSFGVAIIDKIQSVFSIGVLSIKIRESSQINLQKVLEKYNATLIYSSERDGKLYANIKIDLDKVDLSKLEELIYMSNSYNQVALKNLEISSLNTAKTLVCLLDMLVNSSDLIELVGVDRLVSSQGRSISPISNQISTDENKSESYDTTDNSSNYSITTDGLEKEKYSPHTSISSWWLSSFISEDMNKSTDIVKAWEYSVGNGVNVAIIDQEFGYIDKYSDFDARLINKDSWIIDDPKYPETSDKKYCNHGFKVASIIGAESDDFLNISGVANKSNIIPISRGISTSSFKNEISKIASYNDNNPTRRISVVNISSTFSIDKLALLKSKKPSLNCITPIFTEDSPNEICDTDIIEIQTHINKLSNTKTLINGELNPYYDPNKESVIIVSAVGNNGINGVKEGGLYKGTINTENPNDPIYLFQYPSSLSNVIGVGAYEMKNIDNGKFIRADFKKDSSLVYKNLSSIKLDFPSFYNTLIASNYGDNVDVWAPGDNIPIHIPAKRDIFDSNNNRQYWLALNTNDHETVDRSQGTSFASPIVAGVAAMLKFWKPDLTVKQFATILNETGSLVTDPSFLDSANKGQRFLNALEAVQYQGINAQKYQVIKGNYSNNELVSNNQTYKLTPNNPTTYSDLKNKDVIVLGWIKGDEINILQMREANQTLSYNGKAIPIVQPYGQTVVSTGDKIAIPLPSDVIERLQNISIGDGFGNRLTYYEIINNYAIYGIPPTIAPNIQNIIARDLSTGDTILTFEQALYRAALAMNLNPVTPPDALMLPDSTSYPPFIYDNTSRDVRIGDIVAAALYGLSKNDTVTVTVNGQNMPIYDQKDGYLSFKIQGGLSGTQNVSISTNNQSVTYHDALNILGGVSNNQKIAFIENNILYTINSDGSSLNPLASVTDYFLSWSPDKSKIAYTSNESFTVSAVGGPVLLSKLVVTNSDGTSKIKVSKGTANSRDFYPVWSYDGTKIAFFRYDYSSDKAYLCTVDFNDSSENILLEIPKYITSLSWSRDNKKISYVVQNPNTFIQELHVFDGTIDRKLFDNVGASEWTLDNKIVYTKDNMIMKCSIDGSNNVTLTSGFRANISNNGTKIAFMNQNNIYTMNIDGSNITKITNYDDLSDVNIQGFSWSQNDSAIVYSNYSSNDNNYYISTIENNTITNLYSNTSYVNFNYNPSDMKWSIKNKKDNKKTFLNNIAW